jgi:hypothetical protein
MMNKHFNPFNSMFLPVLLVILSGFTSLPANEIESNHSLHSEYILLGMVENTTLICNEKFSSYMERRDCTVKIKTDDMDIEVTLHDVSWWDCTKLKLKALWEFGF